MIELRKEFQRQQESKFSGTELLFETSNEKYINWLEQKVVKNINYDTVLSARTWSPDEIIEELKDIDAFDAAKYFFDKYGS